VSTVQRKPFEPDDAMMRAWLQQERRHKTFLPDSRFRDVGRVLAYRVKSLEDAKRHAAFSRKNGTRSNSQAQFARNTMYQLALIETRGRLREAAEILGVSPGAISQARLGMKLGAEFHRNPDAKFESHDVLAMSPVPEIRLSSGPQVLFDRYAKCFPEVVNKVRNLFGWELSDTAVFLLMDLATRSRPDKPYERGGRSVSWAFHIFSAPGEWLVHTSLSRSQFYRALKQLRDAGLLFEHGHRHWVIAYRGPMFKWLCQQGFVAWEALANKEYCEATVPGLVEEARGAWDTLCELKNYRPLRLAAVVKDYFEYVFASVRRTLRFVRDVAVQVYSRTKRLLDLVGIGDQGLSHDAAWSDPDPPGDYAASLSGSGTSAMKSSLSTV